MIYQFSPDVTLLLVDESDETVGLVYQNNVFELPQIGPRPPYYTNPRYKLNFPII